MARTNREQSRGLVRLLSVAVPLVGLALLYPVHLFLRRVWSAGSADATVGLLMLVGVLGFSFAIFRVIDQQDRRLAVQHRELQRRYETERRLRSQLEMLHQASLAIASARTPAETLQQLVALARELIGARYGALGVLGREGVIDDFYTAGLSEEERTRLGAPPQGHELLSVILTEGASLRLREIAQDPRAVGFPPGHPPMHSLVGVPVAHAGQVVGNLYLADKAGAAEFSTEDERLLTLLAGHAAVVIQNARLGEQVRRLAVVAERHRIGRDLHDGVIQALYAVNLELEDAALDVESHPHAVRDRLDAVIDRLGEVMKDIRHYILGLQPERATAQPLPDALALILAEVRVHTLLDTELHLEGSLGGDLQPGVAGEVLQMTREAVTNVVRHARASRLWVSLESGKGLLHLRVADNGAGFDPAVPAPDGHHGLRNLRERAEALGGRLELQASPGGGTIIDVWAPTGAPEREEAHA